MKRGNGWKLRLIGGLLGAGILAAGTVTVIANYRDTEFQPDGYIGNWDRKDNQIVFPGQDVSLGDEQSDESELWEQDANADNKLKPEDQPSSSMLFQTMKVTDEQGDSSKEQTPDISNETESDIIYSGQTPDKKQDSDRKVIVNPGNNNGKPGNRKPGNNGTGNDDPANDKPGNNRSGTTEEPTTGEPGTTEETGTTEEPTTGEPGTTENPGAIEEPTTEDAGTTEEPTTEEPATEEPVKPKKDPDTTVPTVPKNDTLFPADPYPDDGKVDISDEDDYERYSLFVIGIRDAEDQANSFYMGEYLNDQRVLCSVIVYVCKDDVPLYRLTELNENFRLGEYPEQVTTDSVPLTFYYRPDAEHDWIEADYDEPVTYSGKLLLQSEESGSFVKQYMVQKDNPTVELYEYYPLMKQDASDAVIRPFIGWSETEDGSSVGAVYQAEFTGAKVLYPLYGEPLSTGLTANWMYYYFTYNGISHYTEFQTLTDYPAGAADLVIPDGIQIVNLPGDLDWDTFLIEYKTFDTISIPESLLMFRGEYIYADEDTYTFHVKNAYKVDPANMVYSSYEGILLDKEQTVVYAVPEQMTSVTVPETVTRICDIWDNQIQELHFLSDKPCDIDFTWIQNAKIYVPADSYLTYLAAWGKEPGGNGNELLADGDVSEDFAEDDNAIYSADKKILKAVKKSVSGVYIVEDGVEEIAEGAFANCGSIDILILPASVKKLDANSLNSNPPEKVVFLGETAPEITEETFAESSVLQVLEQAKEDYTGKWSEILGTRMDEIHYLQYEFVRRDAAGFAYLNEEESEYGEAGAILLSAPATLTYFDASSDKEVRWKEIANSAFADCQSLYMAELPETVKELHEKAFYGCNSLEGIVSYSQDRLKVGQDAFSDVSGLRFVAFQAIDLDCYDYYGSAKVYGVIGSTEYSFISCFSPSFFVKSAGDGRLLYGVATDDENQPVDACYLYGATTNISGKVVLEDDAVEILAGTFQNCTNPFTVSGLEHIIAIGDLAFSGSAFSGSALPDPESSESEPADSTASDSSDSTVDGELSLASGLVYLGTGVFQSCSGLTKVTIDGSGLDNRIYIQPFGVSTFKYCDNLTEVSFTGTGHYEINDEDFAFCTKLASVHFDDTVGITDIGRGVFFKTALIELTIPASVQSIGSSIIDDCDNFEKLTFLSKEPPLLSFYVSGFPFFFTEKEMPDGWVSVPKDCEQAYVDSWKYYMIGYTAADTDFFTEEDLLTGENKVRAMLGLEPVTGESGSTGETDGIEEPGSTDALEGMNDPEATPGDAEDEK